MELHIGCIVEGHGDREAIRMPSGRRYVEILDPPALAAQFDFDFARRSQSFDKCYREFSRLLSELRKIPELHPTELKSAS